MSEANPFTTRHYLPYIALLLILGAGIWLILAAGSRLNSDRAIQASRGQSQSVAPAATPPARAESPSPYAVKIFQENLRNPLSILLLQLIVIIVAARLIGRLFLKIGQPPVMGEMVAGIVLGPSVLGLFFPGAMVFLFPASSMLTLRLLSQVGVVLFMFLVGMELDLPHLREKARAAVMVSNASVIVPFFLGAALSLLLYRSLAPVNTQFTPFALFMGIAMSITAFPVLARILEDRGMSQSPLGVIAITCAAVDDLTAWCALALVIAIAQADGVTAALLTIVFALCFILLMLFLAKPQVARLLKERPDSQKHGRGQVAGILAFVLACALVTEMIGIHALFGAFLAGVVMPPLAGLRLLLKEKLEAVVLSALLPLFFAFTGLRMEINLLNDWRSWLMCAVIIVVAIAGKLGGSMLMARWTGMSWRDSFSLGVLMNTRGLVELIVLNIGYDLGILSARAFTMMVLMALLTTFMTGPLLSLVKARGQEVVGPVL